MSRQRILVVDDEPLQRWALRQQLTSWDYLVDEAGGAKAAVETYRTTSPDVVLLDLRLGADSGFDVLQQIREIDPSAAVIMVTAHGDLEDAVTGFRMGLADFFKKPLDFEALRVALRYRLESQKLRAEIDRVRELDRIEHRVIGNAPAMKEALRVLEKVAVSGATTVLLQGESGSGKDLFAKELHRLSARRDGPFIAVNCAALPGDLLESELFGHEKGAFTDAHSMKRGVFELANDGTLYLDEVGEMRPALQAKLLRVIEDVSFRRVGGTRDLTVDARVVAASNRNLEQAVHQGLFRPDLFFRLSVIQIHLPPLRERREDIPALVGYFADRLGRRVRGVPGKVTDEAMDAFKRYHWPGNVRELRNCVERALILEEGDWITPRFVPAVAPHSVSQDVTSATEFVLPPGGTSLERVEESLVRQAMALGGGNQTRAARLLGISRDALRYKLKKFGVGTTEDRPGGNTDD
jgi:DNA-binding NtrC family response regulator